MDLNAATDLSLSVFDAVWTEYYAWEQAYARDALAALARPNPATCSTSTASSDDVEPSTSQLPLAEDVIQDLSASEYQGIYVEVWDAATGRTSRTPMDEIAVEPLEPHPPYESCTPTSRNIFTGDDSPCLPFVPYADDPAFDFAEHCMDYTSFSWQTLARDPDLEAVVVETARRLYFDHGISFAHIDETGVLPLELLSRPGRRGLLHASYQRDFIAWPGSKICSSPLPRISDTAVYSAHHKLSSITTEFCPNLNCIQGYCSEHLIIPVPNTTAPTIRNESLLRENMHSSPCSDTCFLADAPKYSETIWAKEDMDLLRTVLDVTPDTLPCDIATICRKPCREVYDRRRSLVPDMSVILAKEKRQTRPIISPAHATSFTPNDPCQHTGPCTARTKCPCFLNSASCERSCRCPASCKRRWPGCHCLPVGGAKSKTCRTERCPCFVADRECDPERCLKCNAKHIDVAADVCQNAGIQQERRKAAEIKRGKWGLGFFLREPVEKDELIAEYVGEIIFEPTTLSRDDVARHRRRNYLFGVNAAISVDGTYVANDTRYINHSLKRANAQTEVRLVNGAHRIGVYAKRALKLGAEVFINYGSQFFQEPLDERVGEIAVGDKI